MVPFATGAQVNLGQSTISVTAEIDSIQQKLIAEFNKTGSLNTERNIKISNSVLGKVDDLQATILKDSSLTIEDKNLYLTGLKTALAHYISAYQYKEITADEFPDLLNGFAKAIEQERTNSSIIIVLKHLGYNNALLLMRSFPYHNSSLAGSDKELLVDHIYRKYPEKIFPALFVFPEVSITDSLLPILARKKPEELYNYSQAKFSELGKKINSSKDSLVQLIAGMADKKEGQLFFPFTGSLIRGELHMTDISKNLGENNRVNYFKLLVKTQVRYSERLKQGDTAIAAKALRDHWKRYALANFVTVINGLHDRPDAERFKVIEPLKAQDLYYVCIAGADELYTSSYLYLYNRIFKTSSHRDSYDLLRSVHFDQFKRFIKLASNFNTLPDFLQRMDSSRSNELMKSFVDGLQYSNSMEDAVDVADSYGSIRDIKIRSGIRAEIQHHLEQAIKQQNLTGITIYELLNTLFTSFDATSSGDLSYKLDIPSVYNVDIDTLRNKAGKIIIREFFYGDEDGKRAFNSFLKKYSNAQWKIRNKKDWVEFHATDQSGIIFYANKPLDELNYKDIAAQDTLRKYLANNKLVPTVVIHRGHSYFVKYTIRHLTPAVKIVLLGSCGGYNNLKQVIEASPYVHIIASKQEGNSAINQPIIVYLTKMLREGNSLYWPDVWTALKKILKSNSKFDDYIPPYQNLGAIFIMAFNRKMANQQ